MGLGKRSWQEYRGAGNRVWAGRQQAKEFLAELCATTENPGKRSRPGTKKAQVFLAQLCAKRER